MNRPAADRAAPGSVRFLVKLLLLPVRKSTPVAARQGKPIWLWNVAESQYAAATTLYTSARGT